jgi:hypothetical protein
MSRTLNLYMHTHHTFNYVSTFSKALLFRSNAHFETSLHICKKCHALYHVVPLGILSNYFLSSALGPNHPRHSLCKGGICIPRCFLKNSPLREGRGPQRLRKLCSEGLPMSSVHICGSVLAPFSST